NTRSTRDWSSDVCSSDLDRKYFKETHRQRVGQGLDQPVRTGLNKTFRLRADGRVINRPGDLIFQTGRRTRGPKRDVEDEPLSRRDRKSTRLNSSHEWISY